MKDPDDVLRCATPEVNSLRRELDDLKVKYAKSVKALWRIRNERMSVFLNQKSMLESKLRISDEVLTELGEKEAE